MSSDGEAERLAVHHGPRKNEPMKIAVRERMSDTFQVFKEKGIIHRHEYDANVPANVHGAPKDSEVRPLGSFRESLPFSLSTITAVLFDGEFAIEQAGIR